METNWKGILSVVRHKAFWKASWKTLWVGGTLMIAFLALLATIVGVAEWLKDKKTPLIDTASIVVSWWSGISWQVWAITALLTLVVCIALVAGFLVSTNAVSSRAEQAIKHISGIQLHVGEEPVDFTVALIGLQSRLASIGLDREAAAGHVFEAAMLLPRFSAPPPPKIYLEFSARVQEILDRMAAEDILEVRGIALTSSGAPASEQDHGSENVSPHYANHYFTTPTGKDALRELRYRRERSKP